MIRTDFKRGFYEVEFSLPNTPFNKELLTKLFGVCMETGEYVKTFFIDKDFPVIREKIVKFLVIKNLLLNGKF